MHSAQPLASAEFTIFVHDDAASEQAGGFRSQSPGAQARNEPTLSSGYFDFCRGKAPFRPYYKKKAPGAKVFLLLP